MARLLLKAADHTIGSSATALVQVVLYGDYQCPYTARGVAIMTNDLLERMGDALLYVFRNFPLTDRHPDALGAALAAEAAGRQGRFWDMHLHLFRHQRALDEAALVAYAIGLGLDEDRFQREVADRATRDRVEADRASGEALGVHSTPTFFVNGTRYDGAVDGITALVEEAVTELSAPGG